MTFTAFYNKWWQPYVYLSFKYVQDMPSAEDILAEAFVKLWHKYKELPNEAAAKQYLYLTIRSLCIDELTKKRRATRHEEYWFSTVDESYNPFYDLTTVEIIDKVIARTKSHLYKRVPSKSRKVVLLFLKGFTDAEIAIKLGNSPKTVRNLRASVFEDLRRLFKRDTTSERFDITK